MYNMSALREHTDPTVPRKCSICGESWSADSGADRGAGGG